MIKPDQLLNTETYMEYITAKRNVNTSILFNKQSVLILRRISSKVKMFILKFKQEVLQMDKNQSLT